MGKFSKHYELILILFGLLLAISTQYLATHFWEIGNIFFGNLFACTMDVFLPKFFDYWNPSMHGVVLEMVALGVAILIIWLVIGRKEDKQLANIQDTLNRIETGMPTETTMGRLSVTLERLDITLQRIEDRENAKETTDKQ